MTSTDTSTRVLDLDHHKLRTEIRLAAPDEMDPTWEITIALANGDRAHTDGTDGTNLLDNLDDVLNDPEVTAVTLTLWMTA